MMTMTEKLANSLMDDLAALAISGTNGRALRDEEGMRLAKEYAKKTFLFLCAEWSNLTGEDWQIILND